ncbi:hypothetical protein R3P38DRAFT_3049815 [Favolaschia claudopus]|uniref:DUF6534 domain-containing protein n=1 Tax=Favolaschia claudopus TaxID=2862362 RepID=A0AAW0A707_9AGAR
MPARITLTRASLVPLDNVLGTWLIGLILSSVLFGVTCLQMFLYFTRYSSHDHRFLKAFVVSLLILDSLHLALVSHSLYSVVVTNFGDYVELETIPWSLLVQTFVGAFLGTMVQLFYGWRIYILSKKSAVLPTFIGISAVAGLVLAALWTHKSFELKLFKFADRLAVLSAVGLAFGATADLLIAGSMIYHLSKNRTGFQKTNKAISKLVAYSVSTGALTSVCAIGNVIAENISPSTLDFVPFFFILIRLHCLSFMSILNSRDHIREQLDAASSHAMVTIPSYPIVNLMEPGASDIDGAKHHEGHVPMTNMSLLSRSVDL